MTLCNIAFKFRVYPTKEQQILINKTFGCCRFVYNHFLATRRDAWVNNKESINYKQTSTMLTKLKKDEQYKWLKEVDCMSLQNSLQDLDRAYKNFFEKRAKYPRFKLKRVHAQSYRTRNNSNSICIIGNKIKLPKIGLVRAKIHRNVVGRILNATISRTATDKYFVSLCVEVDKSTLMHPNAGGIIGIDVGLSSLYTDSNGKKVNNHRAFKRRARRLKLTQQRLSRKKKGSKNYEKQRKKVARVHEKIANTRKDYTNKQSSILVHENQIIAIETLHVKNMVKNHKLANAIYDACWAELFRQLQYKAEFTGSMVLEIDPFYPSSQLCSCCGHKNPDVKNLGIRMWTCPNCGTIHDRDINAAKNILRQALKKLLAQYQ